MPQSLDDQRIGFVGAGQMAQALARGVVDGDLISANRVLATDVQPAATEAFTQLVPGATIATDAAELVAAADVVVLAVKPQNLADVYPVVRSVVTPQKLFISIAAGVGLDALCDGLGTDRVVRVMPNTPCLIGQGAAGFSLGPGVSDDEAQRVAAVLAAAGLAVQVEERLLDAVTGLSGSGPAYVYQVIEALSDGGVRAGLPRDLATRLAAQTVAGAAAMVLETGEHPAVLKDRVASPGGTTIAGLAALEQHGLRAALIAAVDEATERSRQLGQANR